MMKNIELIKEIKEIKELLKDIREKLYHPEINEARLV